MTRLRAALLAALMVLGLSLFAIACGGDDDDEGGTPATSEDVEMTQGTDLTIAMVTHGDGGSFWSVAKKGAEDGAKAMGVELKYSESNNDPEEQAQLIEAAVTEGVDGIAVSAPNPDAIKDALQTAVDADIPIITLNSGAEESASLGAMTHVGQTETIAGEGAGAKLKEAGATKMLCIIHEQGNVGLNERCEGAKTRLRRRRREPPGRRHRRRLDDADRDPVQARVRHLGRRRARAQPGHRDGRARRGRRRELRGDGRDVRPLRRRRRRRSRTARSRFAVDQQQYLQGYLPVVFLTLNKTNANTVGGGQPVLTGPGFVDAEQRRHGRAARGGRDALMSDIALKPTSEPPPTAVDERLAKVSFLTKLLQRPELGALLGAAVVLLFFALTADRFALAQRRGALDGRRVDARHHGRRGRAADDRRGVRPLRRRDDRHRGPADGHPGDRAGAQHLARDRDHGPRRGRDRLRQRLHGDPDRVAELHSHAGDVLHPAGRQPRRDEGDHRHGAGERDQRGRPGSTARRTSSRATSGRRTTSASA